MSLLTRIFPAPAFLTLPAIGVDFSGAAMRFIELAERGDIIVPIRFGEIAIPEGCMQAGRISDEAAFTAFLRTVKKKYNLSYVRVAIPESQIYLFTLSLDILVAHDIRSAIELVIEDNIPLKAIETVFDFTIIKITDSTIIVEVAAVSETTATTLFNCFIAAGMTPVSFELDAQAIARAVLPKGATGCHMIVDVGAHRTSITVTLGVAAVYTATIDFGGNMLTQTLSDKLGISTAQAEEWKRTFGLSHSAEHANYFDALSTAILPLKDEINRRFIYWQERKKQLGSFPSIENIYICGGHSNLHGLTDYLSAALKLPVLQANPWINCFSFERAIPEMSYDTSMSYVTAIGLALTDHEV